jgi:hypothetical protein
METEKQQSAVNFLVEELLYYADSDYAKGIIKQAKEMEKEQIMNAREDGHVSTYAEYGETPKCYLDGGHEQYYNETFKSE